MPILIPDDEQIEKFELIVAPMDAAIRNNYEGICRLQAVRDSLLPRLMSGELDVPTSAFKPLNYCLSHCSS